MSNHTDRITAALEALPKSEEPLKGMEQYEARKTLIAAAPDLAEEVVRLRRLLKECADRAVVLYCADRCDFTEVGKESCRHVGGCEEMRKYRAAIEGGRE